MSNKYRMIVIFDGKISSNCDFYRKKLQSNGKRGIDARGWLFQPSAITNPCKIETVVILSI